MGNESKIIRKTDDSALLLLQEVAPDHTDSITDIDSYYLVNGTYVFLEFIHCSENAISDIFKMDEPSVLKQVKNIWDFVQLAEGRLWLIFYDDRKEHFLLKQVVACSHEKLSFIKESVKSQKEFKEWFQLLNKTVLQNNVK